MGVSVLIRRITLAALVAAFVGGLLAIPASAKTGPVASASKCKKAKKGKHRKKKKCGSPRPSGATLPGQATHPTPTAPAPALRVSDIGLTDNPVLGGSSTAGQVTVDRTAPAGGQSVNLLSDTPGRAAVPASVVVPAGQTSASFPVSTTTGASVTASLTAAIGGSNDSAPLHIVSTPSVVSLTLERQCFSPNTSYGSNRVTLDVPPAADTAVDLLSDRDTSLSVPSTVTVPSGSKSAYFGVDTLVPWATPVTVTATLGSSQQDDTALVSASPDQSVSGLSFSPTNVTVGSSAIGTVTLTCEASADTHVTLHSDFAGVTVPTEAVVLAGQLTATFTADTNAVGTAHVTADSGAGGPKSATLQVDSQPD